MRGLNPNTGFRSRAQAQPLDLGDSLMRLFHEQPRHCHQRSLYKLYCAYACVRVRVQGRHAYMHACVHAYACMRMHSRSRDLEHAYMHTHHTHTHTHDIAGNTTASTRKSTPHSRTHTQNAHTQIAHTHTYMGVHACMHTYTYIKHSYVHTYIHMRMHPHSRTHAKGRKTFRHTFRYTSGTHFTDTVKRQGEFVHAKKDSYS
jgi:hypothetical protein